MRARIRTVKPEFFKHEALFDLEMKTNLPMRLAFEGLWVITDRQGRFQWRPRTIKSEILPYDNVDMAVILDKLASANFVVQYEVDGELFGWIPTFDKHQCINNRESESDLPCPSSGKVLSCDPAKFTRLWNDWCTRHSRVDDASLTPLNPARAEGEGEGNGKGTVEEAREHAADEPEPNETQRVPNGRRTGAERNPKEANGPPPAAAEANAKREDSIRAILGQDMNSNVGRALSAVPDEILDDWCTRYTAKSLRETLKKAVNKIIAKEGGFQKVQRWSERLTSWVEREEKTLVKKPPKVADPPPERTEPDIPLTPQEKRELREKANAIARKMGRKESFLFANDPEVTGAGKIA